MKKGDVITIERGVQLANIPGFFGEGKPADSEPRYDRSWCGDVLEVLSYDAPFIVAKNHTSGYVERPLTINEEEVIIKYLSQEFIDAMGVELQATSEWPEEIDKSQ